MRLIQEEEGGDSDRGERGEEGVAGIEIANGSDGRDVAEARPTPEKKMIVNHFCKNCKSCTLKILQSVCKQKSSFHMETVKLHIY